MTEQERINANFDRRTKRVNFAFWTIYLGLLLAMIFVTVKRCG